MPTRIEYEVHSCEAIALERWPHLAAMDPERLPCGHLEEDRADNQSTRSEGSQTKARQDKVACAAIHF